MNSKHTFSYGHPLGRGGYLISAIVILVGLFFLFQGNVLLIFIGCGILTLGVLLLTLKNGVIFDLDKYVFCYYGTFKKHPWLDLKPYTDLCVLTKRYNQTMSYKATISTSQNHIKREIYLMQKNHLNRIFIETLEEDEDLTARLSQLSKLLGAEIKPFNPATRRKSKK